MKVKVLESFRDKTRGLLLRKENEEFEVNSERAKELEFKGLVKIINDTSKKCKTKGGGPASPEETPG